MDKLKAMRVFVEIADANSLTGAAKVLSMSLTSVVRSLAGLEENLGVRLFNRNTRKIVITDEGREYYQRCRTILSEIEDAESMLSERQAEPLGRVSVTAPVTFGKRHVAPKINAYLGKYPKMTVDLIFVDRTVDMLSEGIDIAVRIGRIGNHDLVARQLGKMRHVLCASPDFLASRVMIRSLEDIRNQPSIQLSALDHSDEWSFESNGEAVKMPLQSRLSTNQVDVALNACINGVGLCRFLHYQVIDAVKRGELCILLEDYEPRPLPVHLLYAPVKLQSKRLRSMTEWLTRSLQRDLELISSS